MPTTYQNIMHKFQYTQTMKQREFFERELARNAVNEKLAALKKTSASCFSCSHYKPLNLCISVCKQTGHKVKFYNICEKYSAKE
jgi:hypothetical protein